jgi:hypothetical protein
MQETAEIVFRDISRQTTVLCILSVPYNLEAIRHLGNAAKLTALLG